MKLYLAYGYNTNKEAMLLRCPAAICFGKVIISDYRMVFRDYADIEYFKGSTLECVLWDITDKCEKALDTFEGYPNLYGKGNLKFTKFNQSYSAMIYMMVEDFDWYYPPSDSYVQTLIDGYTTNGLNLQQIYQAEGYKLNNDTV